MSRVQHFLAGIAVLACLLVGSGCEKKATPETTASSGSVAKEKPASAAPEQKSEAAAPEEVARPAAEPVAAEPSDAAASADPATAEEAAPMPDVLAKVGDESITKEKFLHDEKLALGNPAAMDPRMSAQGQLNPMARQRLFQSLINNSLLTQYAEKLGIKVTDEELKKAMDDATATFPDEAAFKKNLEMRGVTLEEAENQMKDRLRVSKLFEDRSKDIKVSDEELQAEYQRVLGTGAFDVPDRAVADQLFLPVQSKEDKDWTTAEDLVNSAYERVQKGEKFADVAAEVVKTYPNAQTQDNGSIARGTLDEAANEAVFSTPSGEVCKPFRVDQGWVMLLVKKIEPAHTLSFDEVRPRMEERLLFPKRQNLFEAIVQDAMKDIPVEVYWQKGLNAGDASAAGAKPAPVPVSQAPEAKPAVQPEPASAE